MARIFVLTVSFHRRSTGHRRAPPLEGEALAEGNVMQNPPDSRCAASLGCVAVSQTSSGSLEDSLGDLCFSAIVPDFESGEWCAQVEV
eukprot:4175488-Pyramimonas_sp.AAC.1